ncbi:MAG: sodium:dicarboxylate symporter [Planctomycetes bacterium RBG_16_41_13]|nr:MAG: sodium:dicarboxylate symporter [Planctomycetes bacterium RBG_16_41_13]
MTQILPNHEYSPLQAKPANNRSKIILYIIIAVVAGMVTGGFVPDIAVKFSLLGEIFINALMMLVIPIVILSLIVGITNLGDLRSLGTLGWRTIVYYMTTTGIAVLLGIALVNIIQPGKGLSTGENHPDVSYTIQENNPYVIQVKENEWRKKSYNDKYRATLLDKGIQGTIQSVSGNLIRIKQWKYTQHRDVNVYTTEEKFYSEDNEQNGSDVNLRVGTSFIPREGKGIKIELIVPEKISDKDEDTMGDVFKQILIGDKESGKQGMLPHNIFAAMAQMEILPLIVFSLLIGLSLSALGPKAQSAVNVISILNDAVMKITHWVLYIAPIGIFGLISSRVGQAGGFSGFVPEMWLLGKYSFTVLIGLAIHGFVILPLILKIFGKRSPVIFGKGMSAALLNAFSTASSSATLPLTMQCAEEKNKISNRTASFVLPLGATINMDGTALYEAVTALFIAQAYGITMTPAMQIIIFLTATLAAIGAAGIPEAGLITMVIVLKSVGLPIEGIGLILAIDWLLDRFRTAVNVWGDSVGAGVIERYELKKNI